MSKPEYISLTTAIDMFEEYKIEIIQYAGLINEDPRSGGDVFPSSGDDIYKDFLYFIIVQRISLFGINTMNNLLEVLPESVVSKIYSNSTNQIHWTLTSTSWKLQWDVGNYHLRNNYDYMGGYNPSTNYDVLYFSSGESPVYTYLCVLYKDFVELVKKVYKTVKPNE